MARVVTLSGGSPWGFRLVGGKDFRALLAISKVTPGGKADRAGLKAGDVILAINNAQTDVLSHLEAQNQVKSSTHTLLLKVETPSGGAPAPVSNPPNPSPVVVQNSTPTSYTPKPATYSSTATHSWQPKASQAPTASQAPLPPPPSNDDFLPPPPSSASMRPAQTKPAQDDFPAPPPPAIAQLTTQQAGPSDKIVCEGCKQPIRGSYLTAQGKTWHPEEFVCSAPNCGKSLQNCGFVEEKGQRYCSDCYEKHYAHLCGRCHKKIVGEVMHALNQTWHVTCFVCVECGQKFTDGVFQMENDKPYCVTDYNKLFGTKCKGCGFSIGAGDHYVEAIKAQWHDKCFICAVCHCDLKNQGFFSVNEKPVCSNHKNARLPA